MLKARRTMGCNFLDKSNWVISEVGLTWLGLDDLADCGEYIYKHRNIAVEIAPAAQAFPTPSLVIPTICSCNGLEI